MYLGGGEQVKYSGKGKIGAIIIEKRQFTMIYFEKILIHHNVDDVQSLK